MTRWRQRMGGAPEGCARGRLVEGGGGEDRLVALLQESLAAATRTGAAKPADFTRVIVDTTVQPKAIAHPTDAKLRFRAREHLVRHAQRHGVALRQSYARVGKIALIRHQRYAQARQFKRAENITNATRPGAARHSSQDQGQRRLDRGFCSKTVARRARARATTKAARPKSFQPACAGGRVHRQRQGPQTL